MSVPEPEPTIFDRLSENPSLQTSDIRRAGRKAILVRFAAGATTSVIAGLIALAAGARGGGILLAFPAILAASLTLIEEEGDAPLAREDARGAILGAVALTAFAAIAAATLGVVSGGLALLLATVGWALVAGLGYRLLWWRRAPSS